MSSTFRDFNGSLIGNIKIDNPFIPEPVRTAALASDGLFTLGKAARLRPAPAVVDHQTYRAVVGLEESDFAGGAWTPGTPTTSTAATSSTRR